MSKKSKRKKNKKPADRRIMLLRVELTGGPVSEEFLRANPRMARTIQIRATQTLEDLHVAIFHAFSRYDEHLWEFQLPPRAPGRLRRTYGAMAPDIPLFANPEEWRSAEGARLGQVGLKAGAKFRYWFDFGDDWWHDIEVLEITTEAVDEPLPRVVDSIGESPPQYPGDEDDDEWGPWDDAELEDMSREQDIGQ